MSNLDNIKNKIMLEAQDEAEAVLDKARRENEAYLARVQNQVEEEIKRQIAYAKDKAGSLHEQIIAGAELKARDTVLAAQQELLTTVLDKAKEKLLQMSDEELSGLIQKRLETYRPETGDVLVLPVGRNIQLPDDIPVEYDARMKVGFALKRGGVSEKYDYIEILDYQRDELEHKIIALMQET